MGNLDREFGRLGFPVEVSSGNERVRGIGGAPFIVTVVTDKKGKEKFSVDLEEGIEALVLDVRPDHDALLLMIREDGVGDKDLEPVKMLLGHDERQLFIAAVPRNSTTVVGAMEALKPVEVTQAETRAGVKGKKRLRRKNKGRVRQGDFFFVPVPDLVVPEELILTKEPINRGRGASHTVEFLYRAGGEVVWVCRKHPYGVSHEKYRMILRSNPKAKKWDWRQMRLNAGVYAKGRVTHREHATIVLRVWHRVIPNTEASFDGFQQPAFLD